MLRHLSKFIWWSITFQLSKRMGIYLKDSTAEPKQRVYGNKLSKQKVIYDKSAKVDLLNFLSSGQRISFSKEENPEISVVIVVWNRAHLTLRCLQALLAQNGPSLEIILVDNASTDETNELLSRMDGARILRGATNEGFLLGCNRGAAASLGRMVLLLNNDAFVRPDALASALSSIDAVPDAGAVGGRLILLSGLLQEAGGIIWVDASTQGYGRGWNPEVDEVMFLREVDYCSGAFLMTPRKLWNEIGGLDEVYRPGYYEEADYCMRLRQAGYRILYEPNAIIDHYEYGSEVKLRDTEAASQRNRRMFRARHAHTLRLNHLPPARANILTARIRPRPSQLRQLLVVSNEAPPHLSNLATCKLQSILSELTNNYAITLFSSHHHSLWRKSNKKLFHDIEIIYGSKTSMLRSFLTQRKGYYDTVLACDSESAVMMRGVVEHVPSLLDGSEIIYDVEALSSLKNGS